MNHPSTFLCKIYGSPQTGNNSEVCENKNHNPALHLLNGGSQPWCRTMPRELLEHLFGPIPRGLTMCISKKFPHDADLTG